MPLAASALLCLVIAVSDGDTLTARCGDRRPVKVRIAAIDAPERRQAFGDRARAALLRLCLRQTAQLRTVARDDYGRTVAHVRCAGQDVGGAQVGAGLAWVYAPRSRPDARLAALQRQAQARRAGLWSQARPQAPWEYRRRARR
ncbi:thermonuclease family protein [Acidovorax sp. NCPPB 4044]|uniref:thermonuclease family protein n=1 Tax=Acidovorax sp. NCPPB 4044 TaxID=2940490 RepID=UPI002304C3A1|nr:thermonuclease family protein [Acidovorax sp. NCPPB 4044]MDA8521406.1 thermonuclease family protein [Acidovorax sp. NCPPB 4044]